MSSWDVARLTVRLGDHNIKISSEVRHIEKRVKRVVRHRGFDSRTLVGTNVHFSSSGIISESSLNCGLHHAVNISDKCTAYTFYHEDYLV